MCGINQPVAEALRWLGWEVYAVDLVHGQDLTETGLQRRIFEELEKADGLMVAMDCSTLSRAREIPMPDGSRGPPPLRSQEEPQGLSTLSPANKERVEEANSLVDFLSSCMDMMAAKGAGAVEENPANSYYWQLPPVQARQGNEWIDVDYAACCLLAARHKLQRLRTNCEALVQIRSVCEHKHCPGEWKPWQVDGSWVYPTKAEQEYTATLAFNIAIGMTMHVIKCRQIAMYVPQLIPPQCQGDRSAWLVVAPILLRKGAMMCTGIRLEVQHPNHFRDSGYLPTLSVLHELDLTTVKHAEVIYIGTPVPTKQQVPRSKTA